MNKIKCPHCGEEFNLEESDYDAIAKQIRGVEFEQELHRRLKEQEAIQQAKAEAAASKEEAERAVLKRRVEEAEAKEKAALEALNAKKEAEIAAKNAEITRLQSDIRVAKESTKNEVTNALMEQQKKLQEQELAIAQLKSQLDLVKEADANQIKDLKAKHLEDLKGKDEQIAYYKDLKTRMSTKLVGETLEQHCLNQFNSIRMAAYPNAYFEKDNDASSGSKGDFIFRELTSEGAELISIMFEMKNENDTTATKHKNEDFLKELDKDRTEKKCEYAVLVSMLEPDSDYYNAGIVESYKYPKMFIVRPQCFLAIISLLRNAALNAAEYKNQLVIAQSQSVDITNFEAKLTAFQGEFGRNYELASRRFGEAIEQIDKSIAQLQKVRGSLVSSENNLRLADQKLQELTIKKLTKDSPSLKAKFEALDNDKNE